MLSYSPLQIVRHTCVKDGMRYIRHNVYKIPSFHFLRTEGKDCFVAMLLAMTVLKSYSLFPVAVLILFTAAARTWVIAPDLLADADGLTLGRRSAFRFSLRLTVALLGRAVRRLKSHSYSALMLILQTVLRGLSASPAA